MARCRCGYAGYFYSPRSDAATSYPPTPWRVCPGCARLVLLDVYLTQHLFEIQAAKEKV